MPLFNATPFATTDLPVLDRDGYDVVLIVVKATFLVGPDRRVTLADDPSSVRLVDVLRDERRADSSALYPSDVCLEKRGTDVVIVGDAVSRKPVPSVDVAIHVRGTTLPMRVWGQREYYRAVLDVAVGAPIPFEQMPLEYERAYGGRSVDGTRLEARNPAGVGVARDAAELVGKPAPQIEHPESPHRSAKDKHAPVGCGSLLPHWSPRREHAGTFDEPWRATRMPLMPRDFDVRHNNVAPPSLIFDPQLREGDPLTILGMTHDAFDLRLPLCSVAVRARYDDRAEEVRPAVDTVLIEPGRGRVELTTRATFRIGRGRSVLRELRVDSHG